MPALAPRLLTIGALALAFVALTMVISAGALNGLDHGVAETMHGLWRESLHGLFQFIAELGGLEVTSVVMVGLGFYLWRRGFGMDSLVVLAFAGAIALETLYKIVFFHPGPSHALVHADGPSLTSLIPGAGAGNSFPSGHMVRAVVVYGLLTFVIWRLTISRRVRAIVVPLAVALILILAFDRVYLDVHWVSDVVGGVLLGAIALLAGTVWLDRPRKA